MSVIPTANTTYEEIFVTHGKRKRGWQTGQRLNISRYVARAKVSINPLSRIFFCVIARMRKVSFRVRLFISGNLSRPRLAARLTLSQFFPLISRPFFNSPAFAPTISPRRYFYPVRKIDERCHCGFWCLCCGQLSIYPAIYSLMHELPIHFQFLCYLCDAYISKCSPIRRWIFY